MLFCQRHLRLVFPVAVVLAFSFTSSAESHSGQSAQERPVVGQFVRSGENSFGCVARAGLSPTGDPLSQCLVLGPVKIGTSEAEVRMQLGAPFAELDDGIGGVAYVHALSWGGAPEGSDPTTYLILSYDEAGNAKSIQLSGSERPSCCWQFSGLTVGDSSEAVIDALGVPFSRSDTGAHGASLWQYGPWPFSFEIAAGVVSSIRINAAQPMSSIPGPAPAETNRSAQGPERTQRLAPGDPVGQAAVSAYRECVLRSAVRLERSGETADIVAAASVESCQAERSGMVRTIAGDDWRYANVLGPTVDERVLSEAQARVVSIRATRRRP